MKKRPNHRPNKDLTTADILDDKFYTIYEVADILKVHHTTIRRAIKQFKKWIKANKNKTDADIKEYLEIISK